MTDEPGRPRGFHMSARRTAVELGLVAAVLVGGVVLVIWLVGRAAASLTAEVPLSVDETIGEQSSRVVNATSRVCTDPATNAYVRDILGRLTTALADSRFTFRAVVVDSPEVNAFALPGGYVTVNQALLEAAESGEEVAAVLAHELTHVTRRHGTERMLRELGASAILGAVFGGTAVAVPAKVAHDFVNGAYDRDQEREADAGGLALLAKAGIDPHGMASFFRRLSASSVSPPAWLSTHPDPGDRAEAAERAARGAKPSVKLPSPKGLRCG